MKPWKNWCETLKTKNSNDQLTNAILVIIMSNEMFTQYGFHLPIHIIIFDVNCAIKKYSLYPILLILYSIFGVPKYSHLWNANKHNIDTFLTYHLLYLKIQYLWFKLMWVVLETCVFLFKKQLIKWCSLKKLDFLNMTNKMGRREYYFSNDLWRFLFIDIGIYVSTT